MLEVLKAVFLESIEKVEGYAQYALDWFASDKGLHFLICYLLASVGVSLFGLWGLIYTAAIAIGKEWYDTRTIGLNWYDLIADGLGLVAGTFVFLI